MLYTNPLFSLSNFLRVKAIQTLEIGLPPACDRTSTTIVATVSSDGKIRLYDMSSIPVITAEEVTEIEPVAEYDTKGTRLTCITIADSEVTPSKSTNGKRKLDDDEDEDVESEADEIGSGDEDEGDEGQSEEEIEGEEEMED